MRKIIVVFGLILFALPTFSSEMKLLAKFPNAGFYYYYSPDFNVENFQKPNEITKSEEGNYSIFIYNKEIPKEKFIYYDNEDHNLIEDNGSELFSFLMNGINNKPSYYVYRSPDYEEDDVEKYICRFNPNNLQIKYIYQPEQAKYIKQLEFNNGELGITSICNPSYIPGQDI